MADVVKQMEYLPLLTNVFRDGTETTIPCPNELFDAIIRINYLRVVTQPVCDDDSRDSSEEVIKDLLQSVLSFSPNGWANNKALEYGTDSIVPVSKPIPNFVWPGKENWLRVATIFQAAVILYCIRSLALDFPNMLVMHRAPGQDTDAPIKIEHLHSSTRKVLFNDLYEVFSSTNEDVRILGKVLIWPLFVAGVEAGEDANATRERELISVAFRSLSTSIGSLNLRDAEAHLQRYWCCTVSNADPCFLDRRRWEEVFSGVHGRRAFFM
jgi:hypothetical protein